MSMKMSLATLTCVAVVSALCGRVHGATLPTRSSASSYAIVVGMNEPGPGQTRLKYAERDAKRVADVLRGLGGYDRGRVQLITSPSPAKLFAALAALREKLAIDTAAGRQTQVLFYYSGHARSQALNLGASEVPLAKLRATLASLPATLKIVIFDACQSGAFSRVRGARVANDFSHNSIAQLRATGNVVLASSSGTELSQESERLQSGYFTHYLVAGLRGAADADGDGVVSLDETYRYAYRHTLTTTAKTSIGSQHVTLETNLKGKGEVALSYPAHASAKLHLPAGLAGKVLVVHKTSKSVLAEVSKSKSDAVTMAFPPAKYTLLIRSGSSARECDVTLSPGATSRPELARCRAVTLRETASKGGRSLGRRVSLEITAGFGNVPQGSYVQTVEDFDFNNNTDVHGRVRLSGVYDITSNLHLVGNLRSLNAGSFHRNGAIGDEDFSWNSYGVDVGGRLSTPWLLRMRLYGEVSAGIARATTQFADDMEVTNEGFWGWQLGAAVGLHIKTFDQLGLTMQLGYAYAPTIENLTGDTQDVGGLALTTGLRFGF